MIVKPVTVVETRPFIAACKGVLTAEEVATLVDWLATHPEAGDLIQGTGGVRKIRVAAKRRGKSGGARAIYYYVNEGMPIFLLTVFGKGQSHQGRTQRACVGSRRDRRHLRSMTMSKEFEMIMAGLQDALEYAKGDTKDRRTHVVKVPDVDVKAARSKLGLSQEKFATAFGISPSTLRKWEQGQRRPEGPARVLLAVIEKEPEAVLRAITA